MGDDELPESFWDVAGKHHGFGYICINGMCILSDRAQTCILKLLQYGCTPVECAKAKKRLEDLDQRTMGRSATRTWRTDFLLRVGLTREGRKVDWWRP